MIDWLARAPRESPFLYAPGEVWNYEATQAEVAARMSNRPVVIGPSLTPDAVFSILAGLAGAGLTVVPPGLPEVPVGGGVLNVFTSGTTGTPKGVRLSLANLEAAAAASAAHLGNGPDDNWLLAMPLHHVGGLSIIVRQAYSGGSITLLPEFDEDAFAAALNGRVTMASVVPTMLRRLLDLGPFHGLRAVLVGGGPIPPGLLEDAAEEGLPVLPTYGMTETFGQVATLKPGSPLAYRVHPLPGIDIDIVGGRIAVRGDQVFAGYVGEADRDGEWFVTSDLGQLGEDGSFRVLGRADKVVVSGGENVNPERVEAVLSPLVDDVLVLGIADPEWGQAVVCIYAGVLDSAQLAEHARKMLARHEVPKRFIRVDAIPRTSMGKPDRSAASELF